MYIIPFYKEELFFVLYEGKTDMVENHGE